MGRPKAKIDEAEVIRLAQKGAKSSEIGFILGVDEDTIKNRFSRVLSKTRAQRRVDIRAKQQEEALNGNPTMLIWLGKQELEQTDKHDIKSESTVIVKEGGLDTSPKSD